MQPNQRGLRNRAAPSPLRLDAADRRRSAQAAAEFGALHGLERHGGGRVRCVGPDREMRSAWNRKKRVPLGVACTAVRHGNYGPPATVPCRQECSGVEAAEGCERCTQPAPLLTRESAACSPACRPRFRGEGPCAELERRIAGQYRGGPVAEERICAPRAARHHGPSKARVEDCSIVSV